MNVSATCSLLMLMLASVVSASDFDHDAYVKTTLAEVQATAPKISQGADLFFKKRQFEVEVVRGPESVSNGWITVVFRTLGIADPPAVNHEIIVKGSDGKELEMYVQDVLVDALRDEVPVGSRFRAYALYLFFNGHTQKPGFVLSEFEALNSSLQPTATAPPSR